MSYVNTGIERCQTFRINKEVSGVSMTGYPKNYDITAAFTAGGNSYAVLTEQEFQELPEADYLDRLADYKTYIQTAEDIASVDAITEEGYEAYRENTTSCPIGA
jgi:hypothetical protein